MRPRVKPALRRILRDEHTMQYGVHPLRAVVLGGLTEPALKWLEGLDGTRDLESVLHDAAKAGLDEVRARSLLNQLAAQGALHDAAIGPGSLRELSLAERDRMKPDLDALDLASTDLDGMFALFERRRRARVRVYGAGRVGAQIVALLAAGGVGNIRVLDPGMARPADITPGGLTWAEVGKPREAGAVAVVRRLTSGGRPPTAPDELNAAELTGTSHINDGPTPQLPVPATSRPRGAASPTQPTAPQPRSTGTPARPAPPQPRTAGAQAQAQATAASQPRGATSRAPSGDRAASHGSGRRKQGTEGARRQGPEGAREQSAERTSGSSAPGGPFRPTVNAMAGGSYLGDKSDRPDLVILAPVTPLDMLLVNELLDLRIPHLLVSAFEGHGTVGPLVLPEDTACLHCLDLTRRDHDDDWPMVTARLGGYPPGEIACDAALASLVAAAAAGHALAFLDGRKPVVTNGTMEVTPDWRWARRPWTTHPQCRCMRNNPYSLTMVMTPDHD